MDEKVKDKDADPAKKKDESDLDQGLKETFPASDPVSAVRQPDAGEDESKNRGP